jgi:hypothetical protein
VDMGTVTLISVLINAAVAVAAPIIGKRMARKTRDLEEAQNTLTDVSAALGVVEAAVEKTKAEGAGKKVAETIKEFGPAAKVLVDTARQTAAKVRAEAVKSKKQYEAAWIAREVARHDARVAAGEIPGAPAK